MTEFEASVITEHRVFVAFCLQIRRITPRRRCYKPPVSGVPNLRVIIEDSQGSPACVQEGLIPEPPGPGESSRMSSAEADDSPAESSDGAGEPATPTNRSSAGSFLRVVPKRRSLILRQWIGSNGNRSPTGLHNAVSLKECLPPCYHTAKNIGKTIKEQKRKLFHSPLYESEIHLKRLYIQTCKRLPSFGCHVFQVKELLRGKTKKRRDRSIAPRGGTQAHRVLGIGIEHVVLLDSKTLVLAKSQHTSELQQWRAGGGRSHDRLVLEFRGTKWSFVAAQSLRSIGSVLWEIMQDLDARFLDEHLITTREELDKESHRNMVSVHGLERATIYKEELERLQGLLHFPEEVAVRLTDVEYELFYSVNPVHYIRQVTVDLSGKAATFSPGDKDRTVQTLIKRFNELLFVGVHSVRGQCPLGHRILVENCGAWSDFCGEADFEVLLARCSTSRTAGQSTHRRLERVPPHIVATHAHCAILLVMLKTQFPPEQLGGGGAHAHTHNIPGMSSILLRYAAPLRVCRSCNISSTDSPVTLWMWMYSTLY
ncbi:hypothetical protein HPB51_008884 [Rhipicephalus microplus]|uniref:Uncharacterized protein n=1 Tax=Rhipicephalus microplus TaxID=6941 RepID=A0A9J6D8Z6_RHIMP|nr:hypothetical protein HPB51_008884 [Rhipicephalus microplus]